ncbi:MAG: cytochrome-c oxidase, cbb3-type subunit I [Candidatus Eiseniibacteriota bacterium]
MTDSRTAPTRQITYDDWIVRAFSLATVIWALVALLLGAVIASQLVWWQANLGTPWLTFSRLRPLHTNAAIFAFVGNMMFAGIYYSTQRLAKTRMASDFLSRFNFWGWQAIIVSAALTLPLGLTQGKEYAELIWPIDIAVAVVWVAFGVNFFWTLAVRNEKNLYVALWFYIATIVTIAVLHIVNSLHLPTSLTHSYPLFAGVQDAIVQWWYGHNAVGFFLTTPILGIMYYFLPKAADRPVYSYRLSVVHFWGLVFVYIWAGPHHLLYTALPDWAQTLGMVFSLMLWAPSWGGMLNGLLTLRGAWDKLRTDPVIKFFIMAVTFYGMSTFEGPLLSIKGVSALAHYTDWIIGHVHGGALGWNGFMAAGMLYWLVPRLWGTKLWSLRLADAHFWIGTFGILLYITSMWVSGIGQGLYWRALDADGFLKYPDFVEGLLAQRAMYMMRLVGGSAYLVGFVLFAVNIFATVRQGHPVDGRVTVPVKARAARPAVSGWRVLAGGPAVLSALVVAVAVILGISSPVMSPVVLTLATMVVVAAIVSGGIWRREGRTWHALLEGRPLAFTVLVLFAVLAGGVAELIPSVVLKQRIPLTPAVEAAPATAPEASESGGSMLRDAVTRGGSTEGMRGPAGFESTPDPKRVQLPYSPLELEGRDVYVSEGCYVCHSQMIRPFRHETLRYGDFSRAEEYVYDHPFQWGSKRTGPDLHRVGGKLPNLWHYQHLLDPRSTSPGSLMPAYSWLDDTEVDYSKTAGKLDAMRRLGVPYSAEEIMAAERTALSQAALIRRDLEANAVTVSERSRLVALIAYLQRLGRGPQPTGAEPVPAAAPSAASAQAAPPDAGEPLASAAAIQLPEGR